MSDENTTPEEQVVPVSEQAETKEEAQTTDAPETPVVPVVPEVPDATPEQEAVPVEEAERKTGIKDEGHNQDAVDLDSQEETGDEEEAPDVLPSFFVEDEDRIRIELDVLFDKKKGTLVSVSRSGLMEKAEFKTLGVSTEWLEFHPCGYEQTSRYRQQCSVYRRDAGRTLVDPIAMRNYLVAFHLKDWSMRDRKGKKIELKFDDNGALHDDSLASVYKINTTLLDVALTLFEKDLMM